MVNTEKRSAITSNSAVADSRKDVSSKLTRSYKYVASLASAGCQNSTEPKYAYLPVNASGHRECPVYLREAMCTTVEHDQRSFLSFEVDCLLISGLNKKQDRLQNTLRTIEKQGGRGPLGHVDFSELRERLSIGGTLPKSKYSVPGRENIVFPLRARQSVFVQPQLEPGRMPALSYVRLGASKENIMLQYVDKWVFGESCINIAHGILAGSSWEFAVDAYAALHAMLLESLGGELYRNIAVIVRKRWVQQDCIWIKSVNSRREPKPIEGSEQSHEQYIFSIILRDNCRYEEIKSVVLSGEGVTLLSLGAHIIAFSESLESAQSFAKHRRMSEAIIGHIKIDSGEINGVSARKALEKVELRLAGSHGFPAFLNHILCRTETLTLNRSGFMKSALNSQVGVVPIDLTLLGVAHVLREINSLIPPVAGSPELELIGTPKSTLINRLLGPSRHILVPTLSKPVTWEEFDLMVLKPEPRASVTAVPKVTTCAPVVDQNVICVDSGPLVPSQVILETLQPALIKDGAQNAVPRKHIKWSPDGEICQEPGSASISIKSDKGLFSKENGKKLFSSKPAKTTVHSKVNVQQSTSVPAAESRKHLKWDHDGQELPPKVSSLTETPLLEPTISTTKLFDDSMLAVAPKSDISVSDIMPPQSDKEQCTSSLVEVLPLLNTTTTTVDVQQSTTVPAAEPRKHLKWDHDGKELPPFSAEVDTSQVATLTASSEAEVLGRQENSNISTHSVCQESPAKESSPVKTPFLGQSTSKSRAPTPLAVVVASMVCSGSSSSTKSNDSMFKPLPLTTYKDIVASFTTPTLAAVAEIIRIEVREHVHRPRSGASILESSNLNWNGCGIEKLRWIIKKIKSDDTLMLQVEIFNVLNASKICGKLQWTKEMGHEYCTFGLIDKLPSSIEIPSAKLSRLIKEKDEENKYASYLSSLTELDCAAAYYFYSGQLYDSSGIRLDGSFESRVETLRKSSDSSSTDEALLRIRPAFNQLYNKRKILLGRLVSSSTKDWHAYQHPDGRVFELPAGTKILPDEIFRLLRCQKDSKAAADKSLDYPDAED